MIANESDEGESAINALNNKRRENTMGSASVIKQLQSNRTTNISGAQTVTSGFFNIH